MPVKKSYAELEISLHPGREGHYEVELRLTDPQSYVERAPARGVASIDREALLASQSSPEVYGRLLSAQLFAESDVRALFSKARAAVEYEGRMLRVRIAVGPSTPELHDLRWELLRDPETGAGLATSERILLSRLIYSPDWRRLEPRPRTQLRAVIAVTSPSNLAEYGLSEIDVDGEIDSVASALIDVTVTILGKDQPLTLDLLVETLRAGADVVYLVCHGVLGPKLDLSLFLQGKDGKVTRVDGRVLAQRLDDLPVAPSLMVLASCESAGRNVDTARPAFARLLANAGVPAVLVMQGKISMTTVRIAMSSFFRELFADGQVDRALAVARGTVRERSDHWMPALFLRLKGGRLWSDSSWDAVAVTSEDFFRAWIDPKKWHNHCWQIVGREKLCQEIANAIVERNHRVLVMEGRGGIGKSKVLFDLAKRLANAGQRVRIYQDRSVTSRDSLAECPEGAYVLLFDDAHRLDPFELATIIEFAARHRPELMLVFSCRPHGVELILQACSAAGIDPADVPRYLIPNLSMSDRVTLAAQALGSTHAQHAKTLASCFPDSPLFITVAGLMVRTGGISVTEIRSSDSLRRLVVSRFPHNHISSTDGLSEEALQAVVGVMALLLPLSMKEALKIAAVATGLPYAPRVMAKLLDLGIFADVNGRLRILPDLYGSYTALAWVLPRKVSFGRVRKIWEDLDDDRLRSALLQNILEVMRDIASPEERQALRAEVSEIWSERVRALEQRMSTTVWDGTRDLEMMASELGEQAVDLAERLFHRAGGSPPPELCGQLVTEALKHLEPGAARLARRGIDLLVQMAIDGRQTRVFDPIRDLAADGWLTEEIIDALEEPIRRADCPPELFGGALAIVERAVQLRFRSFTETRQESALLEYHRRAADFLVGAVLACPADRRSQAFRSTVHTLVVAWDRWGFGYAAVISDIQRWHGQAAAVLERINRGLANDPGAATSYMVRRVLREYVWGVGLELAETMFVLIREHGALIDRIDDALDISSLRHDVFEQRTRGQSREGLFADIEAVRSRSLFRLLRAAPDLNVFRHLDQFEDVGTLLRRVIEDEIITSPAQLVRFGGTWVEHTIRTAAGAEALRQALSHYWPQGPQDSEAQLAHSYTRSRLDEVYGCAIVRHSDATNAIIAGHLYALHDVSQRLKAAQEAARVLLSTACDAAAVWHELQRRVAMLPKRESPRLYFLLHAIAEARPDILCPLAELIALTGGASVDTLAPLLQAFRARDPDGARQFAGTLVVRGTKEALAVAVTLVNWIGGPADERELLRAVLRYEDAEVLLPAFTAVGVLMARRPEDACEFVLDSSPPLSVQHIEALMRGFLSGHYIRETYPLPTCEHIEAYFAPVGRAFATRMIHPEGATAFEPATQLGMARLTRLFEDAREPAWERMPPPLVEHLVRAMVSSGATQSRGALEGEGSRTFIVECVRRWPCEAFSALMDALVGYEKPITVPSDLLEAAIRPLVGSERLEVVLDILLNAARRERALIPTRVATSEAFMAARTMLSETLMTRLEGICGPPAEELLLDIAHLLRTLKFRQLFLFHRYIEMIHEQAEKISAACLHRVSRLLPNPDPREIEQAFWRRDPEDLAQEIMWMDRVIAGMGEHSPARTLFQQIRDLVRREHERKLREVEA